MVRCSSRGLLWKAAAAILFSNASCSVLSDFSGLTNEGAGGMAGTTSTFSATSAGGGMNAVSSSGSTSSGNANGGGGGHPSSTTGSNTTTTTSGAGGMTAGTSVQSGTAVIPGGAASQTAKIAAVDPTKAILFFGMSFNDAAGSPGNSQVSGALTDPTTLTFARSNAGPVIQVEWYVVEFAADVKVQRGSLTAPATNVANVTIGAVNLTHSFPLISKLVSGGVYDNNDFNRAELTSSTNLALSMDGGGIMAGGTIEWQVVEYTSSKVQSGNVLFDNPTDVSLTATLGNMISPQKSLLVFSHGIAATNASAPPYRSGFTGSITNATTLSFARNAVDPAVGKDTLTYYLVEFTDATSVQSGTMSFNAGDLNLNAALTPVDSKRAVPTLIGRSGRSGASDYVSSANMGVNTFSLSFTDASTLNVARALTGSSNAIANWSVVEFQ